MGSYLIRCGRLFDGVEKMLRERMEIRVEGTQITAVGQGLVPKEQEQVIDLSNATVTPGLIDAHVHLSTFDWKRREYEMLYCSKAWKGMAVLYHPLCPERDCSIRTDPSAYAPRAATPKRRPDTVRQQGMGPGTGRPLHAAGSGHVSTYGPPSCALFGPPAPAFRRRPPSRGKEPLDAAACI